MSSFEKDIEFTLKAVVNKKNRKVLFAEVDSTFVDVLLSLLTFPLGYFGKTFKLSPVGSLSTLHTGLANLDSVHFFSEGAKSILLHPMRVGSSGSSQFEYLVCPKKCKPYVRYQRISKYFDFSSCSHCNSTMEREVAKNQTQAVPCDDDGGFMKTATTFLITDDLRIMPNADLLQFASVLGITDMDETEGIDVTFDSFEVQLLLVYLLHSINPLSRMILHVKQEPNKGAEFTANGSSSNSKTMNLKLMVQKSNNKLLYAEAEEDFVEFLFSFLIIPLGGVESLLSGNTNFRTFDNLYKSAANLIHDKYFKNLDAKNRLLKPNIPQGFISGNHIFSLAEDKLPVSYGDGSFRVASTNFPEWRGSYLKGPRSFKVTDDLTVTPFCIASILSSLHEKKVPLSDVKEVELQIGLKEGLSILKASLTSECALTDALLHK